MDKAYGPQLTCSGGAPMIWRGPSMYSGIISVNIWWWWEKRYSNAAWSPACPRGGLCAFVGDRVLDYRSFGLMQPDLCFLRMSCLLLSQSLGPSQYFKTLTSSSSPEFQARVFSNFSNGRYYQRLNPSSSACKPQAYHSLTTHLSLTNLHFKSFSEKPLAFLQHGLGNKNILT